jgi:aspartate racemase
VILYSVNFGEVKKLTEAKDWSALARMMSHAAQQLEKAGAGCIMIGANTMHKVADEVQARVYIPLIHLVNAVAAEINKQSVSTVALLGTKYTMQLDFYKNILAENGIQTIIPGNEDVEYINQTIYNEFSKNIFLPQTKSGYLAIIDKLQQRGAGGVILGCTEIPILLKQPDCMLPLFDTAKIHCAAAVDWALG